MSVRPRVLRVRGLFALAVVIGCLFLTTASLGDEKPNGFSRAPFTAEEQQKLRAGELVARPTSETRGKLKLMGGTSWQIVNAAPESVFRALLDAAKYDRMLPAVSGAQVIAEEGAGYRRVRLEHKKGPLGISYNIGARVYEDRKDITFVLEDAPLGLPKAAWGFFSVRAYGDSQTLLSYGAMTDPGEGLLLTLVRSLVHEWVLRVPRQVKFFVESREGRERYASAVAKVESDKPAEPPLN